MNDRAVGLAGLVVIGASLFYYAVWLFLLPFVDPGHPLRSFFPDVYYALAAPALVGVIIVTTITTFLALVMIESRKPTD